MAEARFATARILIVDDEPSNVLLLERLLSQAGYAHLRSTTDSRTVPQACVDFQPDLILLDLLMPHLDGYAVLAALSAERAAEGYLPVLVLTADITREARERALGLGAKDFVTKPFDRTEVLLRIANLLETRALHVQLRDQNQLLEVQVCERTQELAETYRAALKASRLKSEFIGTISHELRTPLTHIIGMTNLLLDTSLDPKQQELANIVEQAANGLLGMINGMLDFSRMEAGKLALDVAPFDPREIVENTARLLLSKAREKGIALRTVVAPEVVGPLWGDAGRLRQVLLNLLDNAVKFTERGEVVTHVTVDAVAPRKLTLRFTVCDTGIGMSPATRRRLFEPFTQGDGSLTRKYGGTGLGLVIAKRLVELMDGTIGVESAEGEGSTFWFTLPLRTVRPRSAG